MKILDPENLEFELRFELGALKFDIRFFICLDSQKPQQEIDHPSHSEGNRDNDSRYPEGLF